MSIQWWVVKAPKPGMTEDEVWACAGDVTEEEDFLESSDQSAPEIQAFYREVISRCPPLSGPGSAGTDREAPEAVDYSFYAPLCLMDVSYRFPEKLVAFVLVTAGKHGLWFLNTETDKAVDPKALFPGPLYGLRWPWRWGLMLVVALLYGIVLLVWRKLGS